MTPKSMIAEIDTIQNLLKSEKFAEKSKSLQMKIAAKLEQINQLKKRLKSGE